VCVGGVEHSYAASVELEDQAFFGVHADAVAGELPAVVGESDSLVQLRAEPVPRLDDPPGISLCRPEPLVQGGKDSSRHGHAPAAGPAGQVETGGGRLEIGGEVLLQLVAVDPDADDMGLAMAALSGFQEDAGDLFAVERDIVGPLDARPAVTDLADGLRHGHGARQREQFAADVAIDQRDGE